MFKKLVSGLLVLVMLMSGACGEMGTHARTSAVHDGMRALGLAQMPDGTYEFRLCEMAETYTPETLEEKCINPLLAADGSPLVLSEIPEHPGTLRAHVGNWVITGLLVATVMLAVYGIGRYVAKLKATNELSREAYAAGLRRSLTTSGKYPHFELPEHVENRLLKKLEMADIEDFDIVGKKATEKEHIESHIVYKFADKLELNSGREINVNKLLTDKKLQKSLKEEEAREISELLIELEESLKSGNDYVATLMEGLEVMSAKKKRPAEGVLGKIVREDRNGKFVLEKETVDVEEALKKNRLLDEEYHEALAKLDAQVSEVLGKEAQKLSSRKRNIARLEAAADFDKVLKAIEEVGDRAIVVAQQGDDKLMALTENNLRSMVAELSELIEDGSKGADEITQKLKDMEAQVNAAAKAWEGQAKEFADITVDTEVVRGLESFIKTTRKKTLKGWKKSAKKAKKALEENLETPTYEQGAKNYQEKARAAINFDDEIRIVTEVKDTGQSIVKEIVKEVDEKIIATSSSTDELAKMANSSDLLMGELREAIVKSNDFGALKKEMVSVIEHSNLFKTSDPTLKKRLAKLREDIIADIDKTIEAAQDKAESSKMNFFKTIAARLKGFNIKNNKIFHYGDKGATDKLKDTRFAVKVTKRDEIVGRLANHEEPGEAKVEKGLEKLIAHIAGAATFVAIPVTSLREKLSGHARISAASRWDNLTGSYELSAEGRIDDMHTIIEGIAGATGAKISDEVFYFMLRSGLKSKQ